MADDVLRRPDVVDVLAELHDRTVSRKPAYVTLTRLVTLGGRIPFRQAISALLDHSDSAPR